MDPVQQYLAHDTRRYFLQRSALSLGAAALTMLAPGRAARAAAAASGGPAALAPNLGLPDVPHFAPKAKRVIYLFMAGGPAQQDMLDYKPALRDKFDKDLFDEVKKDKGDRLTTMTSGQNRFPIAPTKYAFEQCGRSGAWVSELLPHFKSVVDDVAIVKSMWTEAINHDPAITYIQTGRQIPGRPSLGAWLSYGLGSENQDLPSFLVMTPTWTGRPDAQALYNRLWGAGFLPTEHAGVQLRRTGDPVLFLSNPDGVSPDLRRRMLDATARLNERQHQRLGDPETLSRIASYEMAFRMQSSVPELTDLSSEPDHIFEMYGPDSRKNGTFARSCLLARRMAERGVRLVQIFHRGWDQHHNISRDLPNQCRDIDQPMTALLNDLKQCGMLEDTLVVWGGEFGRTTYCQGKLTKDNYGRDHHPKCFPMWLAGAGVRPGHHIGETDEYCYRITKDPYHIRDLNATMLHLLGIDHERLSVNFQGLDVRLTGVEESNLITPIMA